MIFVSFMQPGLMGPLAGIGYGRCRSLEALTLGSGVTTTASAQDGEIAILLNTETEPVLAAVGSTPDAASVDATAASAAAVPIPVGIPLPIDLAPGDKLNFKPLP